MTVAIAFLALVFTASSFWWLHARKGRLVGYAPSSFTANVTADSLTLRIPVVLYNSGARGRVVRELRLVLTNSESEYVLRWNDFRTSLRATDANKAPDFADFASGFPVPGRQAERRFVSFIGKATAPWPLEPVDYQSMLQARIDQSDEWSVVSSFTLHLWHVTDNLSDYSSHYNTPEPCTADEKDRAKAAFVKAATKSWSLPVPPWAGSTG